MVSERTRAALAVRKAQGARLGNRTNLAEAQTLSAARTAEARAAPRGTRRPSSARSGTQVGAVLARAVD
jgi:hypothetical protein